jgi:heat shock protein HslJ
MGLRKSRRTGRQWVTLCVIALIATACGGADTTDQATSTPPTYVAAAATPTSTPPTTLAPVVTSPPSTVPQGTPAPKLAGTEWNVTIHQIGTDFTEGLTNIWKTEVTIAFAADGTVSGTTGCNTYQGTWEPEGPYLEWEDRGPDGNYGQAIKLDGLTWTELTCDSEDIMVQEAELIALLQLAGRWRIYESEFTLHDEVSRELFYADPLP